MNRTSFTKSGNLPTLVSAFLYFDISFMVWVLFGPMTPFIAEQLHLSATQKGLLTAVPLLGGSFFRPILGLLADRFGGRQCRAHRTFAHADSPGLRMALRHHLWHLYTLGFLLGIAGASFAVALPLAGRWYPPEHQGLAMGIAGAGNSGTLMATFSAHALRSAMDGTLFWHRSAAHLRGADRCSSCSPATAHQVVAQAVEQLWRTPSHRPTRGALPAL